MTCYICGMPETKLCDGILSDRLINPQSGSCDHPMCDRHAKTVENTYISRRGKVGVIFITKDLCPDCFDVYQSRNQ